MRHDEIRNDPIVSECIGKINGKAGSLNSLFRELREVYLFEALSDIEMAAKKAQERLNKIKFDADKRS